MTHLELHMRISYEPLKVVDDMNDSSSWAQVFRCFEHIKAMNYMNDSWS